MNAATPLLQLNGAEGMATPLAQEQYERMYDTLGGKPVHATLAMHWARLIEMAFRVYDSRLACAAHAVPGQVWLTVNIYNHEGTLVRSLGT